MKKEFVLIFSAFLVMLLIFSCSANKSNPASPNQQVSEMKSGCQSGSSQGCQSGSNTKNVCTSNQGNQCGAVPTQVCPVSNTNNACASQSQCVWEKHDTFTKICHVQCTGEHCEELKCLDVNIVMEDPYFYTSDNYPGYYIGDPVNFEVEITNTGCKEFKHLDVVTVQEYHDSGICDRWWDPNPEFVTITAGEALPGDPTTIWKDVTLKPNQEVVLNGTYTPPISTCSGLDQVSLAITYDSNCMHGKHTLYYNPQAAIYCPPPPAKQ